MSSVYVVVVGGGMQPNTDTDPNSAGQQTDATSEAPTWSGPLCILSRCSPLHNAAGGGWGRHQH